MPTNAELQALIAQKDSLGIATRLRNDQELCRDDLLPSVLAYYVPLQDKALISSIAEHLLPSSDTYIPLVVKRLQVTGIVDGIIAYLAQTTHGQIDPDSAKDDLRSGSQYSYLQKSFPSSHANENAGRAFSKAHDVLQQLRDDQALADTTTLPQILEILKRLSVHREDESEPVSSDRIPRPKCYICKFIKFEPHKLYPSLCEQCGEFNLGESRLSLPENLDLRGKTAFVTGGRINLGYHTALRLLRCGANVVVSTRYPRDADARYRAEKDAESWLSRLKIIGADFRTAKDVFRLLASIKYILSEWEVQSESLGQLFLLVNNAAQTLTDPIPAEQKAIENEKQLRVYQIATSIVENGYQATIRGGSLMPGGLLEASQVHETATNEPSRSYSSQKTESLGQQVNRDVSNNAHALTEHDPSHSNETEESTETSLSIPANTTSISKSSWMQSLPEIPYEDIITAHSINAFVPAILIRELLPLMPPPTPPSPPPPASPSSPITTPPQDPQFHYPRPVAHILNITAREGTFESTPKHAEKRGKHVHTNMAKAALNMITETEASELWKARRIAMNTVDPGYMSAAPEMRREEEGNGPPIGFEDGAARVLWSVAVAEGGMVGGGGMLVGGEAGEKAGVEGKGRGKGGKRERERKAVWGRYLKHFGRERVDVRRGG